MRACAARRWRFGALLLGATVALLAVVTGAGSGAAQGPADDQSWDASLSVLGGQEGEEIVSGNASLSFLPGAGGAPGFFDVFTEISVQGGGAAGNSATGITVIDTQFFLGTPGNGTLIAEVACQNGCSGVGAVQTTQQIAAAIFADGFESGDLSAVFAALDGEQVSLLVRTTVGDLRGLFIPSRFPVQIPGEFPVLLVPVPVPAGLTTFGYCGAPTDTNDLLQRHPELDALFLLNPETAKFDAVQRRVPGNLRPNLPIATGQGMFLRASDPFTMQVQAVQSAREAAALTSAHLGFEIHELDWGFDRGIQLPANCGDATTNTTLLGAHDAISRVATFDPSTGEWIVIGKALPQALRTEVPVPTSGAVVVFADGPGSVLLPCETAECQSFTATVDLFLSAIAREDAVEPEPQRLA